MLGDRPIPEDPLKFISAYCLSIQTTKAGNRYIRAHNCHTTKFILARPTSTTATNDIINTLENDFINNYKSINYHLNIFLTMVLHLQIVSLRQI